MSDLPNNFVYKCQGALVKLSIRENSFKAFLEIIKDPDNQSAEITDFEKFEDEVCNWLERLIPPQLIDAKILKLSLDQYKQSQNSKERRIAQGIEQKPGIDEKLVLLVKPFSSTFEGIYDFKNRFQKHFDIVHINSPIARIYPTKPGVDGFDVYNKTIPYIPGKKIELVLGEYLSLSNKNGQNYQEIVANENGYITHKKILNGFNLNLETLIKYPNGIDHKTGNINFINSIEINGDVKEGFLVEAVNDIKINGNVTCSRIISHKGNVNITGVVIDEDKSTDGLIDFLDYNSESHTTIRCGQSLRAKSLQNASIFSRGNIEIDSSIIRSHVFSSGIINCKGSVYASKISAACGIEVKKLGNENGIKTLVYFLHPIEADIEYQTLKHSLDRNTEKKNKLELFIGPFINNPKNLAKLSPSHSVKIKEALNSIKYIIDSIDKINLELNNLKNSSVALKTSQVNILSECFPGVEIYAEDFKFCFNEKKNKAFSLEYNWINKEFKLLDYQPIKCETA